MFILHFMSIFNQLDRKNNDRILQRSLIGISFYMMKNIYDYISIVEKNNRSLEERD